MTGNTATTANILDLDGIRRRVDTFAFDIVDATNSQIGSIQPTRDRPCTIQNDTTRAIYRSLTGFEVDANQQTELATISARVRPRLILQDGTSYNLGVFLFGDATRPRRSWGLELSASLVDPLYILNQPIGRVVAYEEGTNPVDAAAALAAEVITSPTSVTPTATLLGVPLAWKVSDTRQKVINDLMAIAGYLPVYFDNDGTMQLRTVPLPPFGSDVTYEAGGRIVKDSIIETDDLLKAPNRYIVIESGASGSPIVGQFDLPNSAPNSIANRGFPVVKVLQAQGLPDNDSALFAATAAAYSDPDQYRQVQFQSTMDPRHDTFNIVTLLGVQYREVAWSVTLRSGSPMQHSLRAVYQ